MKTKQQTKTMVISKIVEISKELPESWKKVAGILKGRRKAMERHLKEVRSEWVRN